MMKQIGELCENEMELAGHRQSEKKKYHQELDDCLEDSYLRKNIEATNERVLRKNVADQQQEKVVSNNIVLIGGFHCFSN